MVVFCKINDVRLLHRGLEITNKVSENRHNVGLWSSPIIIPGKHHDDAGQTNEPLCSKLAAAGQQAHGSRCLSNEISRARVTVQSPLAARPAPPLASWETKAKKKKRQRLPSRLLPHLVWRSCTRVSPWPPPAAPCSWPDLGGRWQTAACRVA